MTKITRDSEKTVFAALVEANISFIDVNPNEQGPADFLLGEPASGLHVEVTGAPPANREAILLMGDKAVAFFSMLLRQRREIERLKERLAEAEVMALVAQPHAYAPAALDQAAA